MSSGGVVAPQAEVRPSSVGRVRSWSPSTVVLVAALAVLNLADLITTRLVLDRGGDEGNPVMRPLVHGVWGAALLKVACIALIAVLARRCLGSVRARRGLMFVDAWYVVVVAWNLSVLARA